MATRSTIAYMQPDGSVLSAYCHYDGYLYGVGRELLNNFNSDKLASWLVSGGDMSAVGKDVDSTHYYRDRGEDTPAVRHEDLAGYRARIDPTWHEYNYLWDNGWFWSRDGVEWRELTKEDTNRP